MRQNLYIFVFLSVQSCGKTANITFSDLTQGEYEELSVEVGITSLNHLFNLSRQFVNIVFVPFSTIEDFILSSFSSPTASFAESFSNLLNQWQTIIKYESGFVACAIFGVLFIFLTPLIGIVLCVCRTCCKKCGGKMVQSHERAASCWRTFLSGLLLIITFLIAIPCVFVFLTNEWTNQVLQSFPHKASSALDDIASYVDNIQTQLNDIVREYGKVDSGLRDNVNDLGNKLGIPLRDKFMTFATPALEQLGNLSDVSKKTLKALQDVQNLTTALSSGMSALDSSLQSEKQGIENDLNNPACPPNTFCSAVYSSAANLSASGASYSSLKSVQKQIDNVNDVLTKHNVDNEIVKIVGHINDIPQLVTDGSRQGRQQLLATLTTVNDSISNTLSSLPLESVGMFKGYTENIDSGLIQTMDSYQSNLDSYRYIGGLVLSGIVAFIVVLYWTGIAFGTRHFSVHPPGRSMASNASGIAIMTAAGLTFIFSWVLMLLVLVFFTIGGHGEKYVCQLLEPPYAGLKFADRVFELSGGGLSGINPSASIGLYGLVTDCKNNASVYQALKLGSLFNISAIIDDTRQQIDASRNDLSSVSVDFTTIKAFTPEVDSALQSMTEVGLDQIDYEGYQKEISEGFTQIDLVAYAKFLEDSADNMTNTGVPSAQLQTMAQSLRSRSSAILQIQSSQVDPLSKSADSLDNNLQYVKEISNSFNDSINATTIALQRFDTNVTNDGVSYVIEAVGGFVSSIVGLVEEYTSWLLVQITESFGICRPVYLAYTKSISLICDYFIDILNGLWFSLGWCVFFLIPAAVVGMKLAKFYRRLSVPETHDEKHKDKGWFVHPGESEEDELDIRAFNQEQNVDGKFDSRKLSRISEMPSTTSMESSSRRPRNIFSDASSTWILESPPSNEEPMQIMSKRPSSAKRDSSVSYREQMQIETKRPSSAKPESSTSFREQMPAWTKRPSSAKRESSVSYREQVHAVRRSSSDIQDSTASRPSRKSEVLQRKSSEDLLPPSSTAVRRNRAFSENLLQSRKLLSWPLPHAARTTTLFDQKSESDKEET